MRVTFSYIPTSYWPIDKTEEEQIDVFGVVELTGTISGMKQELQYQIKGRPFVDQVSNMKECKACYQAGFRPFGQQFSWEQTELLLQRLGSICMTIHIPIKPSYLIQDDNVLLQKLNAIHDYKKEIQV